MKLDRELDSILHSALAQKVEPDADLQRQVLTQWKESQTMNRNKKWTAAVAAAACVLAVSVSVGAATRFLSNREVAQELGYDRIAEAFNDGDAIEINETQSYGGYDVTLMGITSGKNLCETELSQDDIGEDKTYVVVAIAKSDGTPMADDTEQEAFFVSPLIQGLNPVNYNAITMNGGYAQTVVDGVCYRIAECDNVECFADRKLYLCVMDDVFYNKEAYNYDKDSGEISVNQDYEGMNLLFDLPLDASKADPEKASEFIESMDELFSDDTGASGNAETTKDTELAEEYVDYIRNGSWKEEIKDAEIVVGPTKVEKNESGAYELAYSAKTGNSALEETLYFYDGEFVDGVAVNVSGDGENRWIAVAEKNEDGSITVQVYQIPYSLMAQ